MAEFKQNRWDNFFYNQHINKVTPHFTFMRQAQNADTHAHKQHRLSQNISPFCSSFVLVVASDMHLQPESEKRAKNVHFHTTKNIQIRSTLFRYFQTNSYKLTSDLFTVVWPQRKNARYVLSSSKSTSLYNQIGQRKQRTPTRSGTRKVGCVLHKEKYLHWLLRVSNRVCKRPRLKVNVKQFFASC